ncbi:hypothetical protein [Nostoc sp.]|uniref:hypothetical protein n=1 Tax=Nostoc sp. TaxID=1180 RepID=UPI002FF91129
MVHALLLLYCTQLRTAIYARISARAVREALVSERGYEDSELPSRQTCGEILNRLGYRLKKHKRRNP